MCLLPLFFSLLCKYIQPPRAGMGNKTITVQSCSVFHENRRNQLPVYSFSVKHAPMVDPGIYPAGSRRNCNRPQNIKTNQLLSEVCKIALSVDCIIFASAGASSISVRASRRRKTKNKFDGHCHCSLVTRRNYGITARGCYDAGCFPSFPRGGSVWTLFKCCRAQGSV